MKIFHVYFVASVALLLAVPGMLRAGEVELILLFAKYQTKPLAGAPQAGEDAHGLYADLTVGTVTQRMRWIAPGSFTMGSPATEPGRLDNETLHAVTLTRGFWLGDSEVTQALWEAVMGSNPSLFKHAAKPVEMVSWEDCHEFHQRLNVKIAGLSARFSTEAEWEYACRAGTTTPYAGVSPEALGWLEDKQTHTVKQKSANAWGLYDMHGTVWEWCSDWYDDYPASAVVDPVGPASGSKRVSRGGSWDDLLWAARSAYRIRGVPGNRNDSLGFRLCAPQVGLPDAQAISAELDKVRNALGEARDRINILEQENRRLREQLERVLRPGEVRPPVELR